jgi:hypothetical protein
MVLVIFTILSWLVLLVFYLLPKKMPPILNFLTYMGLSIIDINKWTLLYSKYHFFQLSKNKAEFLSYILHRDIVFSFILLIMVNLFLNSKTRIMKIGILLISFIMMFSSIQLLKYFKVVIFLKWNTYYEIILLLMMIFITLALGNLFRKIYRKEEKQNEKHYL